MAGEMLLDTGSLVLLLDRSQSFHAEFARFFERWRGPVVSTEAVLVPSSPASLRRCLELIDVYRDLPMDFTDATLVGLAEELNTTLVLTTDRRDFGIYRIRGKKTFRIKPELPSRKKT